MITQFYNLMVTEHQSPLNYVAFCDQFARLNQFECLGTGYFSKAYSNKKSEYVYKVGIMTTHYKKDPYLVYLSKGHSSNPLFPKVRTITIFHHPLESFYVVEMERLQSLNDTKLKAVNRAIKNEFVNFYDNHACIERPSKEAQKEFMTTLKKKFSHHINIKESIKVFSYVFNRFCYDLHDKNMMMRKNGELVITDPVCHLGPVRPLVF